MNDTNKKTGVSFECTQRQRESYIKAAGGRKLGVWIREVLDEAVRNPKRKPPIIADNDDDSIGNRILINGYWKVTDNSGRGNGSSWYYHHLYA